ncbi:MAG: T9SS type A sorting domain-containing protein, partial [Flavobacteriales bacterium]
TTTPTTCSAQVTNATGQLVMTQPINGSQDYINVGTLAPGVYQLRLLSKEGVLGTSRLVVQ